MCDSHKKQLVSLFDMLRFHADRFIFLCQFLELSKTFLDKRDEKIKEAEKSPSALGAFGIKAEANDIDEANKPLLSTLLTDLGGGCRHLGLRFSESHINKIAGFLEDGRTVEKHHINEISDRIQDELTERLFFQVMPDKSDYYEKMACKWKPITDKHPALMEDIDEAGKCVALGRYTASVFHLMRVMESGVKLLGKKLSISGIKDNVWNTITRDIEKAIEAKWPSHGKKLNSHQKKKRQKYNETLAYLKSVRLAWRNEVMHPKDTYTEEEATNIYAATLAFMNSLVDLT